MVCRSTRGSGAALASARPSARRAAASKAMPRRGGRTGDKAEQCAAPAPRFGLRTKRLALYTASGLNRTAERGDCATFFDAMP